MRFVILGLLLRGPLSLYDLHKHFTASVAMFYSASYGALKQAVTTLAQAEQVNLTSAPVGARARTLYSINDAGRAAFREWMLTPLTVASPSLDTITLARVFFLDALPPQDRKTAIGILQERVAAEIAGLQAVASDLEQKDVPAEYREAHYYRSSVLNYGIAANKLTAKWLAELRPSVPKSA